MANLLGIGTSGLLAFQRSLNTVSHNIANVNTEGYSRQSVEFTSRLPQATGAGFLGSGVDTSSVRRSYDAFVEANVRSHTSTQAEFEALYTLAAQIDNVLADPDVGVSASLQRFFNAVQDVADSPTNPAARQVLLSEGQALSDQFNELAEWIEGLRDQVNNDIRLGVEEINRISQSIAGLNENIVIAEGRSGGQPANDLRDQRNTFVRELAELTTVTTLEQDDGSLNVMVGQGQLLVRGSSASTLDVSSVVGDPQQLTVVLKGNGGSVSPITDQLSGGRLGGVINFRDRMLDQASNELGLVAVGMSHYFNEQHNRGVDLNGALGNDVFNIAGPQILTQAGSPGNVTVAFNDIAELTGEDYQLRYNAGAWSLTRSDNGEVIPMSGSGTALDPFVADGLQMEVTVAPTNGDTYLLRPTRHAAIGMQMVLQNSSQIAAAAPVRSEALISNQGTGNISAGVVSDINNAAFQTVPGQLSPPLLVRFSGANSYDIYDNSDPAAPVLLEAGIAYNPATGGEVLPTPGGLDFGYQMRLTGAPAAGDEFTTEYNSAGIGDNRNALLLAGLSTEKLMNQGSASIVETYHGLVASVGTGTRQAELNGQAQQRLLDHSIAARESISGVNLDQEAADLVRYQQAYQAAAQVIAVANSLFETLLGVVRR